MESYQLATEYALKRGLHFLSEEQGWRVNKSTNELKVESRPSDRLNCKILRVTTSAPVSLDNALATFPVLWNNRRLEWDTETREIEVVREFSENEFIQIVRTNAMAKGLVSPRDFVYAVRIDKEDDKIQIYGASTMNTPIPPSGGHVRGHMGFFLQILEKDPKRAGQTRLTYLNELDMRGHVLRSLVDSVMPGLAVDDEGRWRAFLKANNMLDD